MVSVKAVNGAVMPLFPIGIAVAKLGTDVVTYCVVLHVPQVDLIAIWLLELTV